MKQLSLLFASLCLFFFTGSLSAQTPQINNSGFENWETSTSEMAEPIDWNSFKSASGLWSGSGGQQMNKSTQTRPGSTGSFSAVIWAKSILSVIANGNMTTGQINMGSTSPSSTSNYNIAHYSNAAFSEALGGHPDSLIVWVRSKISNSSHQPRIHAVIHDNYDVRDPADGNSTPHIVANATLNFTTTGNVWVRKSIPFIYDGAASSPNYILVSFTTCSTPGSGTANDSLYIDDLELFYNPVLTTGTVSPTAYMVTTTSGAPIDIPFTLTGSMNAGNIVTAQLSDANGVFGTSPVVLGTLATTTSGTINGTIPMGTTTSGLYRVRVVSSSFPLTAADNGTNLIISDVTGVQSYHSGNFNVYFSGNELLADMQNTQMQNAQLKIYSIEGKEIARFSVNDNQTNRHQLSIPAGVYVYSITDGAQVINGKVIKL